MTDSNIAPQALIGSDKTDTSPHLIAAREPSVYPAWWLSENKAGLVRFNSQPPEGGCTAN